MEWNDIEEKTAGQIKQEQDEKVWVEELKRLGRHDLIKDRVGTLEEPPAHYNVGYPPVKYITSHGLGFLEGNIIKYITRYRLKGNAVEDLSKAKLYIDMLLEQYKV